MAVSVKRSSAAKGAKKTKKAQTSRAKASKGTAQANGRRPLQAKMHDAAVEDTQTSLLVLGVFQDELKGKALLSLDKMLKGALRSAAGEQNFSGRLGQKMTVLTLGLVPNIRRLALLGLGSKEKLDSAAWLGLGKSVAGLARGVSTSECVFWLPALSKAITDKGEQSFLEVWARGVVLGDYAYEVAPRPGKGSKESAKGPSVLRKIAVASDSALDARDGAAALKMGLAVARGVVVARDLVNAPPNQLIPEVFAEQMQQMAKRENLRCKIYRPAQLEAMGMHLLLGVGAGSAHTPRLVHLTYTPTRVAKGSKPICWVGKGITFDAGGLCLKPPGSMIDMKIDMGGAAAVAGAMASVAALAPNRVVHGILALAENMPSGTAIRPGDVITGTAGISVEIINTDAEGRLVLADALHYAADLKPEWMVNLATLTGACMVALGPHTAGVFANDESVGDAVLSAAKRSGEDMWRMPLTESLKEGLRSDVAHLRNLGDRYGGAITAALFLSEFVQDTPWAHLDIAGPASSKKEKGATGVGVATLLDMLRAAGS